MMAVTATTLAQRTDVRPTDDDELLLAAARGDEGAFATFYRRWLPVVVGYHLRRTRDRETAFDLTAETFAAVVAGCQRFDPRRGPAAGWLFGIAENKLLSSLRRARVEAAARRGLGFEPVALTDDDLDRVDKLASQADEVLLGVLLAELPPDQQAAIRARVLEEREYPAIAAELRCSEAVVRQRVHRGLTRLRQRLQETP
jgi:RNA polymerase sigma-70 factor, ECF subfamily